MTLFLWAVGAIYFLEPLRPSLRAPLAAVYFLVAVFAFFRIPRRDRWLQLIAASIVVVYLCTWLQQPSSDRPWAPDNATMPSVDIAAGTVHITGFRDSLYRSETDYSVHYHDFDFPLMELDRVWFVVQRFTALEGIAHNFLTFSLKTPDGPRYFSVSVEIRREEGESFSPLRGLYRQYELIYVIADERDEIGSRTVFRPDDRVYLFPVNASSGQVQQLFLDIVDRVRKLREQPEFYHSLTNNCTNNIVNHAYKFTPLPISSLDPRIVAPGFADRLAFSKGLIGAEGESFDDMQQRCRIDEVAREAGLTESFSEQIRKR